MPPLTTPAIVILVVILFSLTVGPCLGVSLCKILASFLCRAVAWFVLGFRPRSWINVPYRPLSTADVPPYRPAVRPRSHLHWPDPALFEGASSCSARTARAEAKRPESADARRPAARPQEAFADVLYEPRRETSPSRATFPRL